MYQFEATELTFKLIPLHNLDYKNIQEQYSKISRKDVDENISGTN
jgi:hypothetical protein